MRKAAILTAILILVGFIIASLALQNGYDLFQKALAKERAEGNLEEAIALYQKVIAESKDKSLAAKAQLRIGICYEKLGRIEAQKAYEMVLKNYADQKETADEARRRLSILLKPLEEKENEDLLVRRVWSGPEVNFWGSLSPNGQYLSFVENLNLCIRDLKTGQNRRLTKSGSIKTKVLAEFSVFSPDSRKIAYDWLNKDGTWDMRIISLEDSEPRVLLCRDNGDYIVPLAWSPDGKRILTAIFAKDQRNLINEIAFVSVKDGSLEVIKSGQKIESFSSALSMSLSPDSRFIAWGLPATDAAEQRDIFLISTDGSREFPVIHHPADDYAPIWAPDGKHILFISDRDGKPGVWMVDVVNGESEGPPKLVKADIGPFCQWMGFTNEGACYYVINANKTDVYIADFNPASENVFGKPKVLPSRFVGSNSDAAWSNDGKYLAYFRNDWENRRKPGASTIIIRTMKTGEEREIPNKLNQPGAIRWFPNGESLLVSAFRSPKDRDYRIDFHRVDVKNGEINLILEGDGGTETRGPGLSPDGKRIFFFCRKHPNETALISYNLESRQKKEIYRIGHNMTFIISVSLSPDGRHLAFVEDNGAWPPVSTVKVMEVGGGNPRDLLCVQWPELIIGGKTLVWTPDGKYLIAVKTTFGSGEMPASSQPVLLREEVVRIPVEGGNIKKLDLTARELGSMCVNPDGSLVAYSALSQDSGYEIWVMENFLPETEKK